MAMKSSCVVNKHVQPISRFALITEFMIPFSH